MINKQQFMELINCFLELKDNCIQILINNIDLKINIKRYNSKTMIVLNNIIFEHNYYCKISNNNIRIKEHYDFYDIERFEKMYDLIINEEFLNKIVDTIEKEIIKYNNS